MKPLQKVKQCLNLNLGFSRDEANIFSIISFRCDNVGQRMMLGFGGVLAAGLAIVASFGFCSAVGVAFVNIVGVVPFLVIGRYVEKPPCCSGKTTRLVNQGSWVQSRAPDLTYRT